MLATAFFFQTGEVLAQNQAQPAGNQSAGQQPANTAPATQTIQQAGPVTSTGLRPEPGLYQKPCNCQAQEPPKALQNPQFKKHRLIKGLGKELGMEMGDLGKDLFLAFSVQGCDPYERPDNPNIPYIIGSAQFVDGSYSHVYKYPDHSLRIMGGFLDGTYACEQADGLFIVQYPNGARGTMKKSGAGCEVLRPDNTVTTVSRVGNSAYRVNNNKLGYMGDLKPDVTGLDYEFAKQNF